MAWFSVMVLFESRVDDSNLADPLWEETIFLIEAPDEETAVREALGLGHQKEISYANMDGDAVSWRVSRIVEVQELLAEQVGSGVEIWSRLFRRRGGDE